MIYYHCIHIQDNNLTNDSLVFKLCIQMGSLLYKRSCSKMLKSIQMLRGVYLKRVNYQTSVLIMKY